MLRVTFEILTPPLPLLENVTLRHDPCPSVTLFVTLPMFRFVHVYVWLHVCVHVTCVCTNPIVNCGRSTHYRTIGSLHITRQARKVLTCSQGEADLEKLAKIPFVFGADRKKS